MENRYKQVHGSRSHMRLPDRLHWCGTHAGRTFISHNACGLYKGNFKRCSIGVVVWVHHEPGFAHHHSSPSVPDWVLTSYDRCHREHEWLLCGWRCVRKVSDSGISWFPRHAPPLRDLSSYFWMPPALLLTRVHVQLSEPEKLRSHRVRIQTRARRE